MTDNLPYEWKQGDNYIVPHPWIDLYFFKVDVHLAKNEVSVGVYKYIGSVKAKIKNETELKLKKRDRMPTYEEMQTVRAVFFKDEELVTMNVGLFPTKILIMAGQMPQVKKLTWRDKLAIWWSGVIEKNANDTRL